ncbi:hypothetical protein SNE40_010652 [Patella caerulea]
MLFMRWMVVLDTKNIHMLKKSDFIGSFNQDSLNEIHVTHEGRNQVQQCHSERQNFVFIKVMKCATESLGPMFRKFGYDRNLTYVLPVEHMIWIGWPFPLNEYDYRPSRNAYNILVEHSIYNRTTLRNLMPNNSIYISSIREPFARFKSAFNCFNLVNLCDMTNKTDPIPEYLNLVKNVPNYNCTGIFTDWRPHCPKVSFSQTHNEMSHTLGMPLGFPPGRPNIENDLPAVLDYIQKLDNDFHLIMIVEHFHESLILLKRLMCWTFKDIFYIKRHVANYPYKKIKPNQADVEFYQKWNRIEYLLYDHFNKTLWNKISQESDDFFDEVAAFIKFQLEGEKYCLWKEYKKKGDDIHYFEKTKWSPSFNITAVDCHLLLTDMLKHLKDIYDIHERPHHHHQPDLKICHLEF